MEALITTVVILAVIALGVLLIHLLNAQHGQRIAAFRYSEVLPIRRGGRSRKRRQPTDGDAGHHDGDRG
ncbi:hypothetical protein IHE55_15465 [Streptomyces pactum]|uniref:Uncharacterized protein n=1 Tax=Streptomyces pactum TaxID=68249 RepID=A0ABS0NLY8_9ACTN|nr:hypothetical protein [Streptomyces pactum]MBH5336109.1 hypothetical protein [Streptomyces pactum]